MKNRTNLILTLFGTIILSSCSGSSSGENICGNVLEPSGNEFTYNCTRYSTENGRFHISSPETGRSTCWLQLINNPYGDFVPPPIGASHINFIKLWLIVPGESYTSHEIPTGTYTLRTNNDPEVPFDIANSNQVVYDGSVVDSPSGGIFNSNHLIASEFDNATATISKVGNIYTVNYYLKKGSKQIKGQYIGEFSIELN